MYDSSLLLNTAPVYDADTAPPLRIWPAIGEGRPAVWQVAGGFAPGYVAGDSAIIFETVVYDRVSEAAFAARIACGECCV